MMSLYIICYYFEMQNIHKKKFTIGIMIINTHFKLSFQYFKYVLTSFSENLLNLMYFFLFSL
jgi:hypothetical protein